MIRCALCDLPVRRVDDLWVDQYGASTCIGTHISHVVDEPPIDGGHEAIEEWLESGP